MQKMIFPVWKHTSQSCDDFRDLLIELLPAKMAQCSCVKNLRITVVDAAVAGAEPKRIGSRQPLPDAVISIYVDDSDSKSNNNVKLFELALQACTSRYSGYCVREFEPLKNVTHVSAYGHRTYGFCQVVFLQRPERLTQMQWLELWQGQHTQVAIDTQATFAYRQNVIERIVSGDQAFYGVSNQAQLEKNMTAMMQSCARFIDFDRIEVIPMSEYVF